MWFGCPTSPDKFLWIFGEHLWMWSRMEDVIKSGPYGTITAKRWASICIYCGKERGL